MTCDLQSLWKTITFRHFSVGSMGQGCERVMAHGPWPRECHGPGVSKRNGHGPPSCNDLKEKKATNEKTRHSFILKKWNQCVVMFAKATGGWPIGKSIRNVSPMLLAMLNPFAKIGPETTTDEKTIVSMVFPTFLQDPWAKAKRGERVMAPWTPGDHKRWPWTFELPWFQREGHERNNEALVREPGKHQFLSLRRSASPFWTTILKKERSTSSVQMFLSIFHTCSKLSLWFCSDLRIV